MSACCTIRRPSQRAWPVASARLRMRWWCVLGWAMHLHHGIPCVRRCRNKGFPTSFWYRAALQRCVSPNLVPTTASGIVSCSPFMTALDVPLLLGVAPSKVVRLCTFPKYLNSPETPLFHKRRHPLWFGPSQDGLRQREQVLIVEGYTDVIACHRPGVTHAVGTLGTALTEHHVQLLKGTRQGSRACL